MVELDPGGLGGGARGARGDEIKNLFYYYFML